MKRRSIIGYTLLLLTIAVFGLLASSCSGRESSVISAQEKEISEADYKRYEDLRKQSEDEEFTAFGQFAYNAYEECLKNNPDAEEGDCYTAAYTELIYSYILLGNLFNKTYSELIDTDTHEGYRKASGTWAECMSREGYEYSYADKGDLFSDLEKKQASVYEEKGNIWDARVSARELEITAYKAYNNCYLKSGLTEVLGELDNTVLSAMRTREEHTIKIGENASGDEQFQQITLSGMLKYRNCWRARATYTCIKTLKDYTGFSPFRTDFRRSRPQATLIRYLRCRVHQTNLPLPKRRS